MVRVFSLDRYVTFGGVAMAATRTPALYRIGTMCAVQTCSLFLVTPAFPLFSHIPTFLAYGLAAFLTSSLLLRRLTGRQARRLRTSDTRMRRTVILIREIVITLRLRDRTAYHRDF